MCVLMVKDNIPCSYDPQADFLTQAKNCTEVIVHYVPHDEEIKQFLQEIQKCVKNGTSLTFSVKVDYGNYLSGFKTKKQISAAMNDICMNEVAKLLALSQHSADKKIEELSSICSNRDVNVK
jgi:hypothetical protein